MTEPKRRHLTQEEKENICKLRIEGSTLQEIADSVGKSKQAISYFFRCFPVQEGTSLSPSLPPSVTEENAFQMCQLAVAGRTVDEIAAILDCSESEIYSVFCFLRFKKDKRKENKNTCYYPNVRRWMVENAVQNKEFARQLGISATTLRLMIYGYIYFPLETAKKAKAISGLSLKEIYSEFYQQWVKEFMSEK